MKKLLQFIWHIPRNIVIAVVRVYQSVLSPDHSFWAKHVIPLGHCPFHPTCSKYMILSLKKYGLIRGSLKGIWRILRCNPWTCGGEDRP